MTGQPERLLAQRFSAMPAHFAVARPSDWSRANQNGRPIASFIEGPTFDRQGHLLVADIPFGRIFRISPQGEWSLLAEYDGWPNGLALHRDGRLFIADYRRGLLCLAPGSRQPELVLDGLNSERFKGVNDLTFSPQGELFFTDQGQTGLHDPTGRVYRWQEPSGRLQALADYLPSPNGLVWNAEAAQLWVAVTRANAVWRLPVVGDTVSKAGLWLQLSGGVGPDGMAADAEGGLVVAHPGVGVWRFDRHGMPTHLVEMVGQLPTNVCFGGPGGRTVFITESSAGEIWSCELPVAGAPLFSATDA